MKRERERTQKLYFKKNRQTDTDSHTQTHAQSDREKDKVHWYQADFTQLFSSFTCLTTSPFPAWKHLHWVFSMTCPIFLTLCLFWTKALQSKKRKKKKKKKPTSIVVCIGESWRSVILIRNFHSECDNGGICWSFAAIANNRVVVDFIVCQDVHGVRSLGLAVQAIGCTYRVQSQLSCLAIQHKVALIIASWNRHHNNFFIPHYTEKKSLLFHSA